MPLYYRSFPRIDGGRAEWTGNDPASVLLRNEFFGVAAPPPGAGAGSSAGVATAQATGRATSGAVGSAAGASTVQAIGAAIAAGTGTTAGIGAANGTGAAVAAATGSAAGNASVSGVSQGGSINSGAGNAAGTVTVAGVGASIRAVPVVDPAYSAAWLPPIRVDRNGKRIDAKALRRKTVQAIPVEARQEVREVLHRIEDQPRRAVDPAVFDRLAADMQAVADMLPAMQLALIAEWRALAYDAAQRAEDERDIEMLLMLA